MYVRHADTGPRFVSIERRAVRLSRIWDVRGSPSDPSDSRVFALAEGGKVLVNVVDFFTTFVDLLF